MAQSKKKLNKKIKKSKNSKKCSKGTKPINIKGKMYCVGKCPHSGGPILYDPDKDDLFCPWHNSRFNVKGKYKSGPAAGQNLKISI
jgi:Rieske Fe-S protein